MATIYELKKKKKKLCDHEKNVIRSSARYVENQSASLSYLKMQ